LDSKERFCETYKGRRIRNSFLWESKMKEFGGIKLADPDSANCGSDMTCVYRLFEELEDEIRTEEEAKDYILSILVSHKIK
jgi:hypothetical protein